MNLDHVFICVDDAPTAERTLAAFGVHFGLRAVHDGQGTANACAFFDNAYLELLWRHDDQELASAIVRPLALRERLTWRRTGASPFGVAFRPGPCETALETWQYQAPFLPPGGAIPIMTPPDAPNEPLVFLIPPTLPIRLAPPGEHRGRRHTVTGVTVYGPRLSLPLSTIPEHCDLDVLASIVADEHRLELDWDHRHAGESRDFRPTLPLIIRW